MSGQTLTQDETQGSVQKLDERGMARLLGPATWERCASFLSDKAARCYELSHLITSTMPASPFAKPVQISPMPTSGIPGTRHVGNAETISGDLTQQGTHLDGLGHFGVLPDIWQGSAAVPADQAVYYGGLSQSEVKPRAGEPLMRLGVENVPPIITTAILLDAQKQFGGDSPLAAGFSIEAEHIETMLSAQGLASRGVIPGDVVYIHTGWGKRWSDPSPEKNNYYIEGPGLGLSGAAYLAEKQVVLVALDNPFTDPVNAGQLAGTAGQPAGMQPGLPFGTHHRNLVDAGILQMQNVRLDELAQDRVWTSCTIILPLRLKGCSGSPVRPIAIGKKS